MASAIYPRYRLAAALIFAVAVVSSAVTIKDDAEANLAQPAATAVLRTPQANQSRLIAAYGRLPLSFEFNQGQTDPRVKFLSRGSGYSLFLTSDEAVLTLSKGSPQSRNGSEQARDRSSGCAARRAAP